MHHHIDYMERHLREVDHREWERKVMGRWSTTDAADALRYATFEGLSQILKQPAIKQETKQEKQPMKVKEFIALLKTYNQDAELKFQYLSNKTIKQISEISKIQSPGELPENSKKKPESHKLVIESITVELQ